jgi:FixJ family two-component response regulator
MPATRKIARDTVAMKEKVAIVDDEPGVRRALKRLVEASGFSTQVYGSGEDFLSDCLEDVACAILDVNLGGMSGLQTSRCLLSKHIDIPVIFITALDSPDVRKEAMELGCCAYLRKPFLGESLMGAIRQAVSHSRPKP